MTATTNQIENLPDLPELEAVEARITEFTALMPDSD